jgi:hypothetical protein
MEALRTSTAPAAQQSRRAASGSRCYSSLTDDNRSSALGEPFEATKSEWSSRQNLLRRPIQEHLSIHIFPTVQTTPTDQCFARLTGAQQIHRGFNHHAAAAATPDSLITHESLSSPSSHHLQEGSSGALPTVRCSQNRVSNTHAIPREGTQDEIMKQVGVRCALEQTEARLPRVRTNSPIALPMLTQEATD